jgi:hypothetical protein
MSFDRGDHGALDRPGGTRLDEEVSYPGLTRKPLSKPTTRCAGRRRVTQYCWELPLVSRARQIWVMSFCRIRSCTTNLPR